MGITLQGPAAGSVLVRIDAKTQPQGLPVISSIVVKRRGIGRIALYQFEEGSSADVLGQLETGAKMTEVLLVAGSDAVERALGLAGMLGDDIDSDIAGAKRLNAATI